MEFSTSSTTGTVVSENSPRRVVVTLKEYNACEIAAQAASADFQTCVRVAKCYGRRLILDVEQCNAQQQQQQQGRRQQQVSASAVDEWIQAYATGGAVDSIEADSIVRAAARQSFLAVASRLDNLENSTENLSQQSSGMYSFVTQYQWNMDMVQARELWATYSSRGAGSTIAVLDSGLAQTAIDAFAGGRIVPGYDFVSDDTWSKDGDGRDPDYYDPGDSSDIFCPGEGDSFHGTSVASVAAADFQGFEGVAPGASIMPVRVLGLCGAGYASDLADGIVWAAGGQINGVDAAPKALGERSRAILMSLSGEGACPSYMQTAVDLALSKNVTLFAAAGNDPALNASDQFPGNCRGVVSVGAWNWKREEAFYSSRNPAIFMPGGDTEKPIPVLRADLGSGVWGMMGTSFAAPHAAGLCSIHKCLAGIQYNPPVQDPGLDLLQDEGLIRAANFVVSSPAVSVQPVTGASNTFFMQWVAGTYTVTITKTQPYQIFMIGGGGGAGQDHSGGAGAGAYFYSTSNVISAGTYTFTVGAGGAGEPGVNSGTIEPTAGGDTFIQLNGANVLHVRGGARGSTWETNTGAVLSGGCGAGGFGHYSGYPGSPANNQGTNGTGFGGGLGLGGGCQTGGYTAGGGGGAGGAGSNAVCSAGGAGGKCYVVSIKGVQEGYGGGGGGGGQAGTSGGQGGSCTVSGSSVQLGGRGCTSDGCYGGTAVANTGSGGGSAKRALGGSGSGGVIILRYTPCIDCNPGTYMVTACVTCQVCNAGTFSSAVNSVSCSTCPAGTYSASNSSVCTPCPAGTYSVAIGANSSTVCQPCPAGSFSNVTGATSSATCSSNQCPAGTYSSAGSSACTNCAAGTYGQVPDPVCVTTTSSGDLSVSSLAQTGYSSSACAVFSNKMAKCWGTNTYGMLGFGGVNAAGDGAGEMGDNLPFVQLGSGFQVDKIAIGNNHACALSTLGGIKCWGYGDGGRLGYGDAANKIFLSSLGDNLPFVDVGTALSPVSIHVSDTFTCVVFTNGQVKCWGLASFLCLGMSTGNVGDAPNQMGSNLPFISFGTGRTVKKLALGDNHACAILDNDLVKCWGQNAFYEVGLGYTVDAVGNAPTEIGDGLPYVDLGTGMTAKDISAGAKHTCAVLSNGMVKCWGADDNSVGLLGFGPKLYAIDGYPQTDNVSKMGNSLPAVQLGTGETAERVYASLRHTCAWLTSGKLKCWGSNNAGLLGVGSTTNAGLDLTKMGDSLPAVSLGSGLSILGFRPHNFASCALVSTFKVKCWGSASVLGLETTNNFGDAPGEMGDSLPVVNLGSAPPVTTTTCTASPGLGNCTSCAAGYFSSVVKATSNSTCQICAAGSFSASAASASCSVCPAGTYSVSPGSTSCTGCPAGYYSSVTGATSDAVCVACPAGSFSASTGSANCTLCPVGTYSNQLALSGACTPCPAGNSTPSAGSVLVSQCLPTASRLSTRTVPTVALTGFTTTITGQSFGNGVYTIQCADTYSPQCTQAFDRSTTTYWTLYSSTASHQYSGGVYNGAYDLVGDGFKGHWAMLTLPFGMTPASIQVNAWSGNTIAPLIYRFYGRKVGSSTWETLRSETSATYASNVHVGTVTSSPVGLYDTFGFEVNRLTSSATGGYVAELSITGIAADSCPAGMYALDSTTCIACPVGTSSAAVGATSIATCVACSAGTYASVPGSASCTPCPAGTFSGTIGANSSGVCQSCPAGFSSVAGSSSCTACPAGTYKGLENTLCTSCPAGTFSPSTGSTSSSQCVPSASSGLIGPRTFPSASLGCTYDATAAVPTVTVTGAAFGNGVYTVGWSTYIANSNSMKCLFDKSTSNMPSYPSSMYTGSTGNYKGTADLNGDGYKGEWVSLKIPYEVRLSGIRMFQYNSVTNALPKNYRIYGKTDAVGTWTTVATVTNAAFVEVSVGNHEHTFTLAQPTATSYNSYAVEVSALQGSFGSDLGMGLDDMDFQAYEVVLCPAGSYVLTSEVCLLCPPGTASATVHATNGNATCAACPAGKYAESWGTANCTSCPAGTSSLIAGSTNASSCQACPAGYFSAAGSSVCTICAAGTYSTQAGASSCTACPAGSVSSVAGASSSGVCQACPAGTYAAANGTTCIPCSPGWVSTQAGSTVCTRCAAGTYASQDQTACQACPAGSYSSALGATSIATCTACGTGTYSGISGATSTANCTPCGAGTYSGVSGATSIATCTPCGAGTYSGVSGATSNATCTSCGAGTYSGVSGATSIATCTPCGAGTFSTSTAATSNATCTPCAAGTYSGVSGATSSATCTLCGAGTYSTAAGATSSTTCTPCGSGTFSASTGASSSTACQLCPAGSASSSTGATSNSTCVSCAAGFYSLAGSATCTPCPNGTYSSSAGTALSCTLCAGGTASASVGATSSSTCKACPAGSYAPPGSASCVLCPTGTYSTSPASPQCTSCPSGYHTEVPGANSSSLCNNFFNRTEGTPCDAGTFAYTATTCLGCPIGTYSTTVGATSSATCVSCPIGTYADVTGLAQCKQCPAGTSSSAIGATSPATCAACPAGYTSVNGSASCAGCPSGTYSTTPGTPTGQCTPCAPGTYSTALAASSNATCQKCGAGTYSTVVGANAASQCTLCAAGTYSTVSGASSNATCTPCASGTYSTASGANSAATCQPCGAGTFSTASGATSSATCQPCGAGTYSTASGANSSGTCTPCGTGTYSTAVGATSSATCAQCPAGTFSAATGASSNATCVSCGPGTYSTVWGAGSSATCTPCRAGTYSATVGATSSAACAECPAGTFSNVTGASSWTVCQACTGGSYTSTAGSTACTQCVSGSATRLLNR